jgi:hypothetical protein
MSELSSETGMYDEASIDELVRQRDEEVDEALAIANVDPYLCEIKVWEAHQDFYRQVGDKTIRATAA